MTHHTNLSLSRIFIGFFRLFYSTYKASQSHTEVSMSAFFKVYVSKPLNSSAFKSLKLCTLKLIMTSGPQQMHKCIIMLYCSPHLGLAEERCPQAFARYLLFVADMFCLSSHFCFISSLLFFQIYQ